MQTRKIQHGFTLIELMIVVAMIGILSAIAFPTYTRYVIRSQRVAAQGDLMLLTGQMERSYTVNQHYANTADMSKCGNVSSATWSGTVQAPFGNAKKHYTLTCVISDGGQTYVITATPVTTSNQKNDGKMTISSKTLKQWDKNNDGSFSSAENTWNQQ